MSIDENGLNQSSFEQAPPIPEHFYVQKLEPQANGNNMIMSVKYVADPSLATEIQLYQNDEQSILLKDNGVYPDDVANDYKYAAFVQENIQDFLKEITEREDKIEADGGIIKFRGHSGKFIPAVETGKFDVVHFENFLPTEVYFPILSATNCETQILKQNSLFITDLSVVEDPARTSNIFKPIGQQGNLNGAWTFGTLMRNMANESASNITTAEFIKQWLLSMSTTQSIGNVNIEPRGVRRFIAFWITKARQVSGQPNYNFNSNTMNWETEWDNTTDTTALIQYAPFKLMAIVNRLDLRSNFTYLPEIKNAGETRFIYTLIDPNSGFPPKHECISGQYGGGAFEQTNQAIDWVGMNVILEYGNPQKNVCDAQSFAQQWYDLSAFPLGTNGIANEDYNSRLQFITDKVTTAGKGGTKNLNKSAINQIRTNEKAFGAIGGNGCGIGGNWDLPDWELRQYEFGSFNDGIMHPALLTNTPIDDRDGESYNKAVNLNINTTNNLNADLLQWIYTPNGSLGNINRIKNDNYLLPNYFLAGTAHIYRELSHFFGFDWDANLINPIYDQSNFNPAQDTPNLQAKEVRHHISLNTCQGCHSGETKTNFTQMMPRGYGEPAKYWDAIPSYLTTAENHSCTPINAIDNRNLPNIENKGTTYRKVVSPTGTVSQEHADNLDFLQKTQNTTNQIVSPFITGRLYSNASDANGNTIGWEDDNLGNNPVFFGQNAEGLVGGVNDPTNKSDEFMNGLYYVNDPSNISSHLNNSGPVNFMESDVDINGKGGVFPQLHTRLNGFNELQRRSDDLCKFLKKHCIEKYNILDYFVMMGHQPFALGSH